MKNRKIRTWMIEQFIREVRTTKEHTLSHYDLNSRVDYNSIIRRQRNWLRNTLLNLSFIDNHRRKMMWDIEDNLYYKQHVNPNGRYGRYIT